MSPQQWSKGIPLECTVAKWCDKMAQTTTQIKELCKVNMYIHEFSHLEWSAKCAQVQKLNCRISANQDQSEFLLHPFASFTLWIHKCQSRFCQRDGISHANDSILWYSLSKPAVVDVNREQLPKKQTARKKRDLPRLPYTKCIRCHLIQFNVLKAKLRLTNLTQNLQSNKSESS